MGNYVGQFLWAFGDFGGFIAVAVVAALWEFLVMSGMHQVLIVLALGAMMENNGVDTFVLVGSSFATWAAMGMAFGAFLRLRDKDEKSLALGYTISAIIGGVTEPVLYGIGFKYKKPFLPLMIGGFCGGLYAGLTHVTFHVLGSANILMFLTYVAGGTGNIINAAIATVIAFGVTAAHGVALLSGCDVCLGQHTNICVGRPLTDPALIPSLCQENGEFKPSKAYRTAKEDFVVLDEVVLEIEAQYRRFVELTGRQPAYFEGHAVMSKNLYKGLEIVAQRHGLDYLGVSFAGEAVPFRTTSLTFVVDSMLPDYDPLAALQRAAMLDCGPGGCAMVIFHPGYLDDFILRTSSLTVPRTKEVAVSCDPATRAWLKENDIQIITYDDLP